MDDTSCSLTVKDVADLLQAKYAIITGGRAKDGCPIITFPDQNNFCNISDENFRKLIIYLTSIPFLQDADLGFVLVVDRRNDKWSAVKTVLLKISGFFPGLVQLVFVLRPTGIFQKAISEVSNKLFKEEFKFKVIICNSVEELHDYVDQTQLTQDLEGCIPYNHEEWMEQRIAVENFLFNTQDLSRSLLNFIRQLQDTELPNDVLSTEELLHRQSSHYFELKEEIQDSARHGETLLKCLKYPASQSCELSSDNKLINVSTVERLLVQLAETGSGLDDSWLKHKQKLHQCLQLRQFEQDFRELQVTLELDARMLAKMNELGDSVARVQVLLDEAVDFQQDCRDDIEKAYKLQQIGLDFIEDKHYAVDCIKPKCVELQRICEDFGETMYQRIETLRKNRDLQERIEKANKWCSQGVALLASHQMEKCPSPEYAENMLAEVEEFLELSTEFKLNNPKEFRNIFEDMITPETKALVQQVLQRIEDVQMMFEKRKMNLKKMVEKPTRPVQPVVPEPAVPLTAPRSSVSISSTPSTSSSGSVSSDKSPAESRKAMKKARTVPKVLNKLIH